jgi:acetyl esterase/lipase
LGAVLLFLAAWIVLPGPTRFLLTFSVGAPEVSVWLGMGALAVSALALPDLRARVTARVALGCALITLGLAAVPLVRFTGTAQRFDAAMTQALGRGAPPAADAPRLLRARPLVPLELLRGIPLDDVRITRDVPVASPGGSPLTVDVYQPLASGRFPVVVQIYGGAWQRGRPAANPKAAQWLASAGYVVFAIDYRHAPAARWPAQIDDVRTALAWIGAHAAEFDADTARVAVMGRSAGAHLALIAAYTAGPLRIRGVVSYYGPADLVDATLHPPHPDPLDIVDVNRTLLGGSLDEMPDRYRAASPVSYVTLPLPPTLLVHAARDHIVEPRYGQRLRDSLTAHGTTAVYLEIPWADHAFDEVFNGPSSQLALYHTERFLAWALATPATSAVH